MLIRQKYATKLGNLCSINSNLSTMVQHFYILVPSIFYVAVFCYFWCTNQFLKKKVNTNTDSIPCFGAIAGLHKFDDGSTPYVFGAKE